MQSLLVLLPRTDGPEYSVEDQSNSGQADDVERLIIIKQTDEVPNRYGNKRH